MNILYYYYVIIITMNKITVYVLYIQAPGEAILFIMSVMTFSGHFNVTFIN